MLYTMLGWVFLHPSVHYYLGQIEAIPGAYGVTWAGLLDALMFGLGLAVFLGYAVFRWVLKPLLFWPVLLYLATRVYAVLISPVKTLGIRGMLVGSVPLLFYLNMVILGRRTNLSQTVARVIVLSSLFPMAVAILQMLAPSVPLAAAMINLLPAPTYSLNPYPGLGFPRVSGSFFTYNRFAVFMGLVFLAVLLKLHNRLGAVRRWVWLGLAVALILAAFTRAVWLSLLAACGLIILLTGLRIQLVLAVLTVACLLVTIITPVGELLEARLFSRQSLLERSKLLDYAWHLFTRQPMGYGAGMAQLLTARISQSVSLVHLRGNMTGGPALHNEYASHAVEGGVIYLGAYLLLLLRLLGLARRVFWRARRLSVSPKWGIWLAAATLMLAAIGFTDSGLGYGGFVFWLLVAGVEMEYRSMRARLHTAIHDANIVLQPPPCGPHSRITQD